MTLPKKASWSHRMRTKTGGGLHASACSCRRAIASPSRCRWTGRGDASWMRPSIQRSTEQTRVVPAAPTVTVDAPSRATTGSGTASSVSDRRACSQASSDRIAATESTPRPCRSGRCTLHEMAAVRAIVPERGVLAVGNEREPTLRDRISAQRGQGHLAEPGQLRASGQHLPTLAR